MIKNNKAYDILKSIALIWLPGVGTLYFTLAQIWKLPAAEQVVGTIVAIDTFLGFVLGISKSSYDASGAKYDGYLMKNPDDAESSYTMKIDKPLDDLNVKNEVRLKVVK